MDEIADVEMMLTFGISDEMVANLKNKMHHLLTAFKDLTAFCSVVHFINLVRTMHVGANSATLRPPKGGHPFRYVAPPLPANAGVRGFGWFGWGCGCISSNNKGVAM